MVTGPVEAIGHLGGGLGPPFIRGTQIVIIYYIILLSHLKKIIIITNSHHQIPSGHEGPFLTREKKKDYKWPSPNPIKP